MPRACVDPAQRAAALQAIDDETFIADALEKVAGYLELNASR